jgi:hypothetical protein
MALVHKSWSPIAMAYYERIRPHCNSNSHAYRCLANRWLAVAWKQWQTDQTYDQEPIFNNVPHTASRVASFSS